MNPIESRLIGSVLLWGELPSVDFVVSDRLSPDGARIYAAMWRLFHQAIPIDLVTVSNELSLSQHELRDIGGVDALVLMMEHAEQEPEEPSVLAKRLPAPTPP